MLLLYPQTDWSKRAVKFIYIPLCFYFIAHPCAIRSSSISIYIPLCFYFIGEKVEIRKLLNPFTFHYASTLSAVIWASAGKVSEFTFHYASTLSMALGTPFGYFAVFTFHYASTLSFLPAPVCSVSLHLHSTMLLLYPDRTTTVRPWFAFTFHYASTLSAFLKKNPGLKY